MDKLDDIEIINNSNKNNNKGNLIMSTFLANFHIKFGLKNKGIQMLENIILTIEGDSLDGVKRNLLLWNSYVLLKENIELGQYDRGRVLIQKCKKLYSRDLLLEDVVGNFHVSWKEQIFLEEAKLHKNLNNSSETIKICNEIIKNRNHTRKNALIIHEKIKVDRCKAEAYFLLAGMYKDLDIKKCVEYIKLAIYYKISNKQLYKVIIRRADKLYKDNLKNVYFYLVKYYFKEGDSSYDNIEYLYCGTCKHNLKEVCSRKGIEISENKACALYQPIIML